MAVTMTQPLENGMATKKLVNAKDVFILKNGVEVGLDTIFGEINTSLGNKVNTIIAAETGVKYALTSDGWVAVSEMTDSEKATLALIKCQKWGDDNVFLVGDTVSKDTITIVSGTNEVRLVTEDGKVTIIPNHGASKLEMYKADGTAVEILATLLQIQTDLSGTKTKADSALQPSSDADAWPTDNVPVDNKVYNLGTVTTISVKNPTTSSNGIRIFFTAGTGGCVISSTDTLKWLGDTPASTLNAGKNYVIAILDGLFSITEIVTE